MRERLQALITRIDALELRERALIMLAVLTVLWALWDVFLMQPLERSQTADQARIETLQSQVREMDEAARQLLERSARDPDRLMRTEIAELEQALESLDATLEDRAADLIEPRQMARMLEEVLTRESGLRLRSLRSLPAEPLIGADQEAVERIYRHGVEIEFTGTYMQTLDYLRAVEDLPWRFFWEAIELDVERHPRVTVRILVYTLGSREGLLGV